MPASTAVDSAFDVESFIHEYYDAWSGTDLDHIMSYYAEDVVLQIPGLLMEGNDAVRNQFAVPFTTAFPGNRHFVKKMISGPGVVNVEFSFEAQHKGPFAGHAATGARISLPGCGVYEYDSANRQITAGRIYFDVGTLLQTITDSLVEDRDKATEALRTNERNLSLITNVIPTFIHVLRTDGSVLYVNQAVLGYTGLTLEDVRKGDYRDRFFHPEDVERLREERREALTHPVPFENEQRVLGKDGKYRWFLIRYNPLLDEQGRIDRWYAAAFDIEARKQAEEALRQSEERARLMVHCIDGLIMTATPKGEVEFVNQQVLDYFGKSLEELKYWRTNDAIHPDDLPRALALWMHSLETGDSYEFDERLRRAEGAYRWFRVRGRCVRDSQDHVVRWYVLLTDIDEGKRAEEQVEQAYLRLTEAQRLSKTGSFITDLLADDHDWSEEAFRIFEFDPGGKVTVQMIRDAVHPDDLATFEAV